MRIKRIISWAGFIGLYAAWLTLGALIIRIGGGRW